MAGRCGTWDVPAVSPDGRYVAYTATAQEDAWLWLRPLGADAPRQVTRGHRPFWSPDSRTIGFFAMGTLSSVLVSGGSIEKRAIAPLNGGGTWMTNGDILFTPVRGGAIHRLASGAGRSEPVTEVDTTGGELGHDWPNAVPGTDRFTFLSRRSGANEAVARLGEISARNTTALGLTDSRAVPTASGHLLWVRDGTLMAQRLDATRSRLVGHSTAIAHDVAVRPSTLGHFSASDDAIVFLTREAATAAVHMTMFDRGSATVAHLGDVGEYSSPRVSPDGKRVAVARRDPQTGTREIWIHDVSGQPPLRLTFNRHDDTAPVWSADGRTIFFTSDRRGERDLYRKDAGAQQPERLLYASEESKSLNAVSRDGRMLIYDTGARGSVDRARAIQFVRPAGRVAHRDADGVADRRHARARGHGRPLARRHAHRVSLGRSRRSPRGLRRDVSGQGRALAGDDERRRRPNLARRRAGAVLHDAAARRGRGRRRAQRRRRALRPGPGSCSRCRACTTTSGGSLRFRTAGASSSSPTPSGRSRKG